MSRIQTIPPQVPFLKHLAKGLLEETSGDPLSLARILILLPSRRACRMMRQAFLQATAGKIMLLPKMRPLDGSEDTVLDMRIEGANQADIMPSLSTMERRILLLSLVQKFDNISLEQAIRLTDSLTELLDSLQIEQIHPSSLTSLITQDSPFASHWQDVLQFLNILIQAWPNVLSENKRLDPQERINRLIHAQAQLWHHTPPPETIIAAGVMWVRPATVALLKVIAELPKGRIILAGLDQELDEESWQALEATHPQYALKNLLERLEVSRATVKVFGSPPAVTPRIDFLREAMRPAATSAQWRDLPSFAPDTLNGVIRLDAATPQDEAQAIALIMRQTLETAGKTAALVTPDRSLARRVIAALQRWGIAANDSAGQPLPLTSVGSFLRLLTEMVADNFSPLPLLSCLKHPMATAGRDMAEFRSLVRKLEIKTLRGARTSDGLTGLRAKLGKETALLALLDDIEDCLAPFMNLMKQDSVALDEILEAHLRAAESLATSHDRHGGLRLWQGEAGETMAQTLKELKAAIPTATALLFNISPSHYPSIFNSLIMKTVVRSVWGKHPRLFLWGPLESRLVQADVMILGGLNEGIWTNSISNDPWMSRPMRSQIGLPAPEETIGRAAHDFTQSFTAPEVILTRAERIDGTPTIPSRWLSRLEAVMKASKLEFNQKAAPWLEWQAILDDTESKPAATAPTFNPPLELRPRQLSVTAIETLRRDPYGIYANRILKLKALDPLDADISHADYGTFFHEIMVDFITKDGDRNEEKLKRLLQEKLNQTDIDSSLKIFWKTKIEASIPRIVELESQRQVKQSWCELSGKITLALSKGEFTLTAKADRIDQLDDGTFEIIDYKTGTPPKVGDVNAHIAPQLPLEGWIAQENGFPTLPASVEVNQLTYWGLRRDGKMRPAMGTNKNAPSAQELIGQNLQKLKDEMEEYLVKSKPYCAIPNPRIAPKYNDYRHLERQDEWLSPPDDTSTEEQP